MRIQFIGRGFLVCPYCVRTKTAEHNIDLYLYDDFLPERGGVEWDGDVKNGVLLCRACKRSYPIINGVAVFTAAQGSARYQDHALAQSYVQTHYRDIIAKNAAAKLCLEADDVTGFYSSGPTNSYYEDLVEILGTRINPDSIALDFGCSVGRLSHELARKAKFVIGVDLSFVHIELARDILLTRKAKVIPGHQRVSGSGTGSKEVVIDLSGSVRSNVEFIVADEQTMPFRDGTFHVICFSAVVDRVPDANVFFRNLDRLAHQGASLLVSSPFSWREDFTPREKWLGFNAFGTAEGPSETGLENLLRRGRYGLVNRRSNIPWVNYDDKRHHHVWSVYAGVFEKWRLEVEILEQEGSLPDSLIKAYQRVWAESPAYHEEFTDEGAADNLKDMDVILVAKKQPGGEPIGFAGGKQLSEGTAREHVKAYETLRAAVGDPVFYISEWGVLPEFQGSGVGSQLLEQLLGIARANGHHTFILITNPDNDKAMSLYRRMGFSSLSDDKGLVRVSVSQRRRSGETKTDLRPYLYRVDDFSKVTLKHGWKATLEFIRPESIHPESLIPIAKQISKLFGRAFWHSDDPALGWPVDSIMKRLPAIQLAVLAFDALHRKPVGYALFSRVRWNDHSILFANSEAVSGGSPEEPQDWQGSGLGIEILKEGLRRMPCDIVAARTQNAAIAPMLRKLNPSQILPVDAAYSGDGIELLKAIKAQVVELRNEEIDFETGVSKRVYKEGKLGDYESALNPERLRQFEDRMREMDPSWNREQGDAVILVATSIPMTT